MLTFRCGCGRMLQASEDDASKEAYCPLCERMTPVPGLLESPTSPGRYHAPPVPPVPDVSQPGVSILHILVGAVVGSLLVGLCLAWWGRRSGAPSMRRQEANNLRQLAIALHAFHDDHGALPMGVGTRGPGRKPLLSWRVLILPYIEQEALYKRFKLDESWGGPNNLPLLAEMPSLFRRAGTLIDGKGLTHYQVVCGTGTAFDEAFPGATDEKTGQGTIRLGQRWIHFADGTSNTLVVVTAATPVPWTKPADFDAEAGDIPSRLRFPFSGHTLALTATGHVQRLKLSDGARWRAALTTSGREFLFPEGWD